LPLYLDTSRAVEERGEDQPEAIRLWQEAEAAERPGR
jgi:hypothetical protein